MWEAKRRFGPGIRGTLLIKQTGGNWDAEIAGRTASVKLSGAAVAFELPDGKGSFQGTLDARRIKINGHWIQPRTVENGTPYASPVTLTKDRQNIWRGEVLPLDDTITFYLMIKPRDDDSMGAFLRNPERNLGRFIRVDRIERDGESIKLFAADSATEKGRVLAAGKYDADRETMSIYYKTENYFKTELYQFARKNKERK